MTEHATFGGGCFWCTEAIFSQIQGVSSVVPGYSGGTTTNPTYEQVCTGTTGHAEVIQITFDPAVVPFRTLVEVFFATHDPTTRNQQGADHGTQYRSIILYHSAEQRHIAEQTVRELTTSNRYSAPIVTEIQPFTVLYPAEEYHLNYYQSNRSAPYCRMVIDPKVDALKKKYRPLLK